MFLKHVPTDDLVEVIDLADVINPHSATILARSHSGDVIQRPVHYPKTELAFPSGESLPVCWVDSEYQESAKTVYEATA